MTAITKRQQQCMDHRNELVSRRIRTGMAAKGIRTVLDLSKKTNISTATLYRVLNEPLKYSFSNLYLISLAVGVDLGDLVRG